MTRGLMIGVGAAAIFVLALVQPGFASGLTIDDGGTHTVSGGTYSGIEVTNSSLLNISGSVINGNVLVADGATLHITGSIKVDGNLDVCSGCTAIYDPSRSTVPEPSSFVALAGLGVMGLVYAWRRRKAKA